MKQQITTMETQTSKPAPKPAPKKRPPIQKSSVSDSTLASGIELVIN